MSVRKLALEAAVDGAETGRSYETAFALAAVTIVLAPVAYVSMFSGFHAYDDEGIFLASLKDYLSGHPVLTPYVPLYGPFFYEVVGGLFKVLGIQPTHDSGRWLTLAIWLIASAVAGLAAVRLTRKLWLGVGAQMLTFIVLIVLDNEPMSTYGMTSLLLLAVAWAAAFRSTWPRATAALIGAIVGALLMIKVNVGAFAMLAVVFAWAASLTDRRARLFLPATALLIAIFPLLLTATALTRDSVLEFVLVVAFSGAAVGISAIAARPRPAPARAAMWLAGGAAVIVVACIGVALLGGSRLADGWTALFIFAIKFPGVFTLPLNVNPLVDVWAALLLAGAVLFARGQRPAWVRIGAGILTWLSILLPSPMFLVALPVAWLATQAPEGDAENPVDPYARLALPALAVLESLQAYPVAGTQLSLPALGLVPVAAITLNDGIRQLRFLAAPRPRILTWLAPATLLITIAVLELNGVLALAGFAASTSLGLSGAETMRLPAPQAAQLRGVVSAVDGSNCSTLITSPGMDSFYLWTKDPGPIQMRYGQWWLTLDNAQQQSIANDLQAQPRLCVIRNQKLIDFWTHGRPPPSGPLVDFIDGSFTEVGTYGDYELLVRTSPYSG